MHSSVLIWLLSTVRHHNWVHPYVDYAQLTHYSVVACYSIHLPIRTQLSAHPIYIYILRSRGHLPY